MDRLTYLLSLKTKGANKEIYDTWQSLGSLMVSDSTKMYVKDTVFQVNVSDSDLYKAIIYCTNSYTVDNGDFPAISWEQSTAGTAESSVSVNSGIMSPHFKILLAGADAQALEGGTVDDSFIPFDGMSGSDVSIDDSELKIILGDVGVPFLRIEELEFTRDAICDICIRPALDEYYAYFPIIEEEAAGIIAPNTTFERLLPENAFGATAFFTMGTAGAGNSFGMGAKAYLALEGGSFGVGQSSPFAGGVSYRKSVPGFVGMDSSNSAIMSALARQGMMNFMRTVHITKVQKNGKKYVTGFSSLGGNLCIKWLKKSYDWNDIDYNNLTDVRKLCDAYVLTRLGLLRSQIKTDLPGSADYSLFTARGDKLMDAVEAKWAGSATNMAMGFARGGH